jgi:hypothetical protein
MRIVRILGALVFLLMMSHPIFAGCNTTCSPNEWGWWDCHMLPPPNEGCQFTVDGCISTGIGCRAQAKSWTVASVEIRHIPGDTAATVEAVAAVEPSTEPHSSTRTTQTSDTR